MRPPSGGASANICESISWGRTSLRTLRSAWTSSVSDCVGEAASYASYHLHFHWATFTVDLPKNYIGGVFFWRGTITHWERNWEALGERHRSLVTLLWKYKIQYKYKVTGAQSRIFEAKTAAALTPAPVWPAHYTLATKHTKINLQPEKKHRTYNKYPYMRAIMHKCTERGAIHNVTISPMHLL